MTVSPKQKTPNIQFLFNILGLFLFVPLEKIS